MSWPQHTNGGKFPIVKTFPSQKSSIIFLSPGGKSLVWLIKARSAFESMLGNPSCHAPHSFWHEDRCQDQSRI